MTTTALPVGALLPHWQAPAFPSKSVLQGQYCRLEPLDYTRHAESLYQAYAEDHAGLGWTYLPYGPFSHVDSFTSWLAEKQDSRDPQFYALVPTPRNQASGLASYLRISPDSGSMEVGHIHFAPCLQGQRAATEAMYLLMQHAFALGYRRYEWKCDALNAASRAAALRLGFTFEGIFRQATVVKGRNRDTAWYSVLDTEWPKLAQGFQAWLAPENFDHLGQQRQRLAHYLTLPAAA